MKLEQLTGDRAQHIRDTYFDVHPAIPVIVHEGKVNGETLVYACTEDYGLVKGPHIYVPLHHRNLGSALKIRRIFKGLYIPAIKEAGAVFLSTNCDESDKQMTTLIKFLGFTIKPLTVGEYSL